VYFFTPIYASNNRFGNDWLTGDNDHIDHTGGVTNRSADLLTFD